MESGLESIHHATARCRASLKRCGTIASLMHHEWAENRLADFNLWSTGVGASAKGKVSLDSRLAFEPDVKTLVINLLVLLDKTIEECEQSGIVEAGV
jgi:hypothetical protein